MIDIDLLRDEQTREPIVERLVRRGVKEENILTLIELDERWRSLLGETEEIRRKKNEANEKIKQRSEAERAEIIAAMREVSAQEKTITEELQVVEAKRGEMWRDLPNVPFVDVPEGGEDDFKVVTESEVTPAEGGKSYLELWPELIDLERGAKVSGSRFVYLKGAIAQLEWALASMAINQLTKAGAILVTPPLLIKQEAMAGMGYLDHAGDEIYKVQDDLYLVGTSEQALGPMHMGEILETEQAPYRYIAYSPCFRREAGSHGKDVKGILRLHQFNKLEMFSFVPASLSEKEHQWLLNQQRELMDALKLPYRVIMLAAGDLGSPSAKTYDIETWIPSEGRYRETHSTSNTTDFQARRLNVRMRSEDGAVTVAHMLNGTAVALSRILIAILENFQQEDGSVLVPEVLQPYVPFDRIAPERVF